jgi:hypothetical protein
MRPPAKHLGSNHYLCSSCNGQRDLGSGRDNQVARGSSGMNMRRWPPYFLLAKIKLFCYKIASTSMFLALASETRAFTGFDLRS